MTAVSGMSGWSINTNPQNVLWFCHVCHWSGFLPAQTPHACKAPKERP